MATCAAKECELQSQNSFGDFGFEYKGSDSTIGFCDAHFPQFAQWYLNYKCVEQENPEFYVGGGLCFYMIKFDRKLVLRWIDEVNVAIDLRQLFMDNLKPELSANAFGHVKFLNKLKERREDFIESLPENKWTIVFSH